MEPSIAVIPQLLPSIGGVLDELMAPGASAPTPIMMLPPNVQEPILSTVDLTTIPLNENKNVAQMEKKNTTPPPGIKPKVMETLVLPPGVKIAGQLPYPPQNPTQYLPIPQFKQPEQVCGLKTENKPNEPNSATLGKGSFGVVYRVIENKSSVALKTTDYLRDSNLTEILIGKAIVHPNVLTIASLYDWPACQPAGWIGYTLPLGLYDGSKIHSHLPESNGPRVVFANTNIIRTLIFGMINGLAQLHANNILHGDIKPQNMIVFPNNLGVLSDFGLSRNLDGLGYISYGELFYTSWYRPPEFFSPGKPFRLTLSMDIWSVGMTIIEMLLGREIWFTKSSLITALSSGKYSSYVKLMEKADLPDFSADIYKILSNAVFAKELIAFAANRIEYSQRKAFTSCLESMLQFDPRKRSTVNNLLSCDYFRGLNLIPLTPLRQPQLLGLTSAQIQLYSGVIQYLLSDVFLLLPVPYWFALVDIVYLTLAKTSSNNYVSIITIAYDILGNIFDPYPGFRSFFEVSNNQENNRSILTEKKDLVYAYNGVMYRRYRYHQSHNLVDLILQFRAALTPQHYHDMKYPGTAPPNMPQKYYMIPKERLFNMAQVANAYQFISDPKYKNNLLLGTSFDRYIGGHPKPLADVNKIRSQIPKGDPSNFIDLTVFPTPVNFLQALTPVRFASATIPSSGATSSVNYLERLAQQPKRAGVPKAFYHPQSSV